MNYNKIIENIRCRLGISELTPVQTQMASLAAAPSVLLIAPTGSGKTIAFTLASLTAMAAPGHGVQTMVITPSRELARQVADVVRNAASGVYRVVACYGGHPFIEEERSLAPGADIVVGTPGRILDHIHRGTIDATTVAALVIDEYDKLLELGFADEMSKIIRRLTSRQRTITTSATQLERWPDFIYNPNTLTIDTTGTTHETRPQIDIARVNSYVPDKLDTLTALLLATGHTQPRSIIFVNHRESADRIHRHLINKGFPAVVMHGGMEQRDRENALEMFANGSALQLVATDLAGRGIDIEGVDAVIHYHLPSSADIWTHRNGRTARMGADGTVYAIISDGETVAPFVEWDREYVPSPSPEATPASAPHATLYINLGKKEKISRGDIVGFITANTPLTGKDIGRITLRDHCALAAIPASTAQETLRMLSSAKIKGKRVKASLLH